MIGVWHEGLDTAVEEKSGGSKAAAAPHQSNATATTITHFFYIGNGDLDDNLGTKNGANSECMKAILLSILKFGYHIL